MKVPYLDLPRQFRDKGVLAAIRRELRDCQFVLGGEVERFEAGFAGLCGTKHALGLNSGTDAIFLALKALGVGPGDEVITVPNSFVATAGAIVATGARPVFVDVGPDYNMDVTKIEPAVTPRTKAMLPVHLTGAPADMPEIMEIARRRGLFVVEDAAQAVGATIDGRPVGSFGHAGAFSLHPLKNLNVAGDGGAVTTNSPKLHEKMKLLRNHGLRNRDEIECFGFNSRLDTIQAAVANHGMKNLPRVIRRRRHNAALYDRLLSGLGGRVVIPPRAPRKQQVFHTYVVMVERREELIAFLAERGVETKIHYRVPIHLQKPCLEMGCRRGDFPVAERQAEMILTLPIHQHLTDRQIRHVCRSIREFYEGAGA
jgi:dTDP-4-amino-4,6-dideoxygalactose transaminase